MLDPGVEDRPQHRIAADLGIEAVHQTLDHGLGDAGRRGDLGRDLFAPFCPVTAGLLK